MPSNADEPDGLKLEWQRRLPVLLIVIIGGVLLASALVDIGGAGPRRPPSTAQIGFAAPAFELVSLGGETVALADYAGSPVVVNFWASSCLPCTEDFPELAAARQRHGSAGLEILGIARNDEERFARDFASEAGATWPLLMDPDGEAWEAYAAIGLPVSYFIDATGVLRAVAFGELDEPGLDEYLSTIGVRSRRGP